jgi:DNA-directed RNA polymerase specialized sigma54-like protein
MLQTRLRPSTQLRPLTTAHLAQTMALIELSAAELDQKIQSELAKNPALEVNDPRRCPVCDRQYAENGPCPRCHPVSTHDPDQPIIFVSPRYDLCIHAAIRMTIKRGIYSMQKRIYQPMC